jgi:two-component system, sensor histidine kinase and response regulator
MSFKVLIVDDVAYNVILLKEIFINHGFEVITCNSSQEVFKTIEETIPDIFLVDVIMPGINGFDLCIELKKIESVKNIPVIFLSAISDMQTKLNGLKVGGVDYIIKPYDAEEVIERVNVHLKIYSLEKENRMMIQSLNQLNQEKDELMQILTHDMKSPLTSVMLYSEILKEEFGKIPQEKIIKYSNSIYDSCKKILEMIKELSRVSKIQSIKDHTKRSQFNLYEFFLNAIDLVQSQLEKKNIELIFEFSLNEPTVNLDEKRLSHIISNLLNNAIKFTNLNGRILINVNTIEKNLLRMTLQDNGIGISKKIMGTLFDKFSLSHRKGTEGEDGTGLGMYITKDFVESMDGKIFIHSEVNQGTEVILEFYSF